MKESREIYIALASTLEEKGGEMKITACVP